MNSQLLPSFISTLANEYTTIANIKSLLVTGGVVLQVLVVVGFLLFSLILSRLWFQFFDYPKRLQACRQAENSKALAVLRANTQLSLLHSMSLIRTTISICPLLGLVGTVVGMIDIFDVIALKGVSSAQLMAGGVARAILPTMAGMVLAITAMFAFAYIQRWVIKQKSVLNTIAVSKSVLY